MMRAEITDLPMFDEYAFIEQHGHELTSDELEVLAERRIRLFELCCQVEQSPLLEAILTGGEAFRTRCRRHRCAA